MGRKKIALLLGQADEDYQKEFTRGVIQKAFSMGMDVYVFSMFIKYQNSREREKGDSNIFSLVDYDAFDGIILLSDTIQTPKVEERIEEEIRRSFKGPVICVDKDSEYFPSFWTDGYRAVYELIFHLITEHHMTDIAYLTGRVSHRHSIRRLEAYQKALEDAGLPVRDDRIFYGDFWYSSGAGCAETLLRDREHMPQAVVCANDYMAIGLAEVLEQNGFRIPEDIAVAGYGCAPEGRTSPKTLTSVHVEAGEYGSFAVECLVSQMEGKPIGVCEYEPRLYLGESCGCNAETGRVDKRKEWRTNDSEEGFYSIHNTMEDDMQRCTGMDELLTEAYENLYYLHNVKRFDLCLNETWNTAKEPKLAAFLEKGYTDQMIWAIGYHSDRPQSGRIGLNRTFERKQMIPEWEEDETDEPRAYLFSPIYHEQFSFGYVVVNLEPDGGVEEVYRLWCMALTRGLETMRRLIRMRELESRVGQLENKIKSIMMLAGDKAFYFSVDQSMWRDVLSPEERRVLETVEDILDNNRFTYHFQPIVNTVDGEIYSYEALMRSATQNRVSPLEIIKEAGRLGRLVDVEKATFFNVLSLMDQRKEEIKNRKIFINSIPGCDLSEEDRSLVMEGIMRHRGSVVVELTEQAELADDRLELLKEAFRTCGASLAVDDYGTGYSNVTNLLRYMPEVVKIDRALISEIQNSDQKEHFVRDVIEFCHANNITALAEGVETADELRCVIRLGADLIQGFYTARPSEVIADRIEESIRQEIIECHKELLDDGTGGEYIAGSVSRISVMHLSREHKNRVIIGAKDATFRDVTIVGAPGLSDPLSIEVLEGYDGRITLENVVLSSIHNRPCIQMSERCCLTLHLVGSSKMLGGGIRVPESAALTIEGDGSLSIHSEAEEGFGIGNDLVSRHGRIAFYQDGLLHVDMNGKRLIGIGAGRGGEILIKRGKYRIVTNGEEVVNIGSFEAECRMSISNCDIETETRTLTGVGIGSLHRNAELLMECCKITNRTEGKQVVGIGTLLGEQAQIRFYQMNGSGVMNATLGCFLGALFGKTDFSIEEASFLGETAGQEVYFFGGQSEDVHVSIVHAETIVDHRTKDGRVSRMPRENLSVQFGKLETTLNGVKEVIQIDD